MYSSRTFLGSKRKVHVFYWISPIIQLLGYISLYEVCPPHQPGSMWEHDTKITLHIINNGSYYGILGWPFMKSIGLRPNEMKTRFLSLWCDNQAEVRATGERCIWLCLWFLECVSVFECVCFSVCLCLSVWLCVSMTVYEWVCLSDSRICEFLSVF